MAAILAEPSFLLLSQNVGNIEGVIRDLAEGRHGNSAVGVARSTASDEAGLTRSIGESKDFTDAMTFVLTSFVHELRRWILLLSYELYAKKQSQSQSSSNEIPPTMSSCADLNADSYIPLADCIVIHFQEIGGRTSYVPIVKAFEELLVSKLLPEAGWCSGLLVDNIKEFTALGSIIFISKRLCSITSMLSIPHEVYVALDDDPCTYGGSSYNLYRAGRFSGAGNSRKGFLLTSFRIGSRVVSFCNCHLYHDDSNEDATSQTPSKYYKQREKGFLELVCECLKVIKKEDPFFIFGDFNARLDGKSLLEYVKRVHQIDVVPEPKALVCPSLFWNLFRDKDKVNHIRQLFDIEPQLLIDTVDEQTDLHLAEMPVRFFPTFKFLASTPEWNFHSFSHSKTENEPSYVPKTEYTSLSHFIADMTHRRKMDSDVIHKEFSLTRIPAWCDRVLFNSAAAHQWMSTSSLSLPITPSGNFSLSLGGRVEQDDALQLKNSFSLETASCLLYTSFSLPFTDHNTVCLLF